jgi:hypothetical protein
MTAATRSTRREPASSHVSSGDFRHQAACLSVDPEVFFPTAVAGPDLELQVSVARAVCVGCPVREACLEWALSSLPDGIAGGMTEHERRAERARRRDGRGRLPRPRPPRRPAGASRREVAAAGRAAIAAGMSVHEAAGEFLVSTRTAGRWANAAQTAASEWKGAPAATGTPFQISHANPQAGTRAEGNRS